MTAGGDHAETRAEAEPPKARRITVTGTNYGDQRLIATAWDRDDREGLIVLHSNLVIAEFHPGQWYGVVDEAHRDPDCLRIARDGLDEIRHAIRQVHDDMCSDELYAILRQVDSLADKAKSDSYLHNHQEPF